ncbi:MAG: transmembrane(s)protein [candidate division WS6 bacterium 34_10]|uniref:Transmembrane(S)protein n=1 Tax=candidate division WS6 bacterium 34_10 TaxID=1641389 RepID=A0A101HGG6_9BACT|nr:MAG: transmembrane(s)protein [candidate division WS6 bacterium 34_10]
MIGFLKKAIWISSIFLFVLFLFPNSISAQESLSTSAIFSHNIKTSGKIETTATFTVNSPTRTVLTYYTITIPQVNIDPEIFSVDRNRKLEATVYKRNNSTDLLIDFENTVIEANGSTKITISYAHEYDDYKALQLISKIADTPTTQVSISYPKEWGDISWISDQIEDIKMIDTKYIVKVNEPDSDSINIIFGQDIAYNFTISRAINNSTENSNQYEIILPQDNQFQKIVLTDISTRPTEAFLDSSNNYVLIFTLEPETQIDLKITGNILMEYHEYYSDTLTSRYNNKDIYWSLEERQLDRVQRFLDEKGVTKESGNDIVVKYLYQYVIENLNPSSSATTLSGGVRRGATEVLKTTEESTPEDYADVLQTLLTLYDREQLDHITILTRTNDSISPILPYYSDNDIRFEYDSNSEIVYSPESNTSISLEPYSILNKYLYGRINIENTGNTIFTSIELEDSVPNINKYIDSITSSSNRILLPHMQRSINFHIPFNEMTDEIIRTTIHVKNGTDSVDSKLLSTEYTLSQRTGYEVVIKIISILLFIITFSIIYLFIDRIVYKK